MDKDWLLIAGIVVMVLIIIQARKKIGIQETLKRKHKDFPD